MHERHPKGVGYNRQPRNSRFARDPNGPGPNDGPNAEIGYLYFLFED
jgi:hypothetical protein